MINREATIRWKGYDPDELTAGSGRRVWRICDGCGRGHWVQFRVHRSLCRSCTSRRLIHSDAAKMKISEAARGRKTGEETKLKIAEAARGRRVNKETRKKMSESARGEQNSFWNKKHTRESKRKNRETHLGMNMGEKNPNWKGGISFEPYCPLFSEQFKEKIRNVFGRVCFLCGVVEEDNCRKLCVHHVNYDKRCICDSKCDFVPLCHRCHSKTNYDRGYWQTLITEMLEYDF